MECICTVYILYKYCMYKKWPSPCAGSMLFSVAEHVDAVSRIRICQACSVCYAQRLKYIRGK